MVEKAFFLLLTHKCNMRCPHCYNELDPTKNVHQEDSMLSVNQLRILFDRLKIQGFTKVMFSGGEALLHPDLIEIICEAKKRNMRTALFTNGKALNEMAIQKLEKSGLDELRISLNELVWINSRRQYQDIITSRIKFIHLLKKTKIKVGFIYIISKRNIEYVIKTYEQLIQLGATMKIQPLFLPENDIYYEDTSAACIPFDVWRNLKEEFELLEKRMSILEETKEIEVYGRIDEIVSYLDLLIRTYVEKQPPDYCPTGPLLVVDSEGDFHPCLFRHDIKMGSINNVDDIDSINACLEKYVYFQCGSCYREECLSAYR